MACGNVNPDCVGACEAFLAGPGVCTFEPGVDGTFTLRLMAAAFD